MTSNPTPPQLVPVEVQSLPTLHGSNSRTFTRPPLDGSLSLPEIYAFHATHSPLHPLFVFPVRDESTKSTRTRRICHREAYAAMLKVQKMVLARIPNHRPSDYASRPNGSDKGTKSIPPVVGILAVADSITMFTLMIAIMGLGLTPFPISTRNSSQAVAHLMKESNVSHLFVSADPAMQRLASEAAQLASTSGHEAVRLHPMMRFDDIYAPSSAPRRVRKKTSAVSLKQSSARKPLKPRMDDVAIILHSSGTSSFPKPIILKHHNIIRWSLIAYFGEEDFCGTPFAAHAMPMFHSMGTLLMVWAACTGLIKACFEPTRHPIVPSPEVFLDAIIATETDKPPVVFCVPSFVEAWARHPKNLDVMRSFRVIAYGGGPISKETGDRLSRQGVKLLSNYGATETGTISSLIPKPMQADEWEYFKISGHLTVHLRKQEDMENIFELVILCSERFRTNVVNTSVDGVAAYATGDLIEAHPTRPGLYRVFGRADDQLMLSTGEKTNPVPLESMLCRDPNIAAAIMFGRGRFHNGVIIQPKDTFDIKDEVKMAQFMTSIWPTMEEVNNYAPAHSRIFKEMIIVTPIDKPLELTAKGTARRQACLDIFKDEIEAVYSEAEEGSSSSSPSDPDVHPPTDWTMESIESFVMRCIKKVVANGNKLAPEDDLFQNGCDSVQATWIRNTIAHAVQSVSASLEVPSSLVYSHPSIRELSDFVYRLVSDDEPSARKEGHGNEHPSSALFSGSNASITDTSSRIQAMRNMVKKYTSGFSSRSRPSPASRSRRGGAMEHGKVVLVTGTTGRLGCHLLSQLLGDSQVKKVYALNRASSAGSLGISQRQNEAFKSWCLDTSVLQDSRLVNLESDLTDSTLGLKQEYYTKLQKEVDVIVHNAWRVNFNNTLSTFEPLVQGTRNLVDFAINGSRLPGLFFVSSIGAVQNHPLSEPIKEKAYDDPSIALGGGYGESKWVAEQLILEATRSGSLNGTVVRAGQLSGDSVHGAWNTKEWVPSILSASRELGCVPRRDALVDWIPVDRAAMALLDAALHPTDQGSPDVLHLVSPKPVPWNILMGGAARHLHLSEVDCVEWVSRLKAQRAKLQKQNGRGALARSSTSWMELVDFLESKLLVPEATFEVEKLSATSSSLREMEQLGAKDPVRWCQFLEAHS